MRKRLRAANPSTVELLLRAHLRGDNLMEVFIAELGKPLGDCTAAELEQLKRTL